MTFTPSSSDMLTNLVALATLQQRGSRYILYLLVSAWVRNRTGYLFCFFLSLRIIEREEEKRLKRRLCV